MELVYVGSNPTLYPKVCAPAWCYARCVDASELGHETLARDSSLCGAPYEGLPIVVSGETPARTLKYQVCRGGDGSA